MSKEKSKSRRIGSLNHWNIFLDALELTHSPERGRFVVASRDIEAGESLIHETALVNIVKLECSISHCYNCQKDTRIRPVPCFKCAAVVFCSIECRLKAEMRYVIIHISLYIYLVSIQKNILVDYVFILFSFFGALQPSVRLSTIVIRFTSSTRTIGQRLHPFNVSRL